MSNFQAHHLRRLHEETTVRPAVNQIEVHPFLVQDELRAFCREHEIEIEAWSPIAQGAVLDNPTIVEIAKRIGKSPAQVVLRWHIQRGNIVFPKSVTPERIRENFELFEFELAAADLETIDALDRGEAGRDGPNPDVFAYVPS